MKGVDLSFIRYSNCWEDIQLAIHCVNPHRNERVLSIASAGDNSFAFLAHEVELVHAIDLSFPQIHLCNLKKEAIRKFTHTEFMEFIGMRPNSNRAKIYKSELRHSLNPQTQLWFDARIDLINQGIAHIGKFEKYFYYFRKFILPLIHSDSEIQELLLAKSEAKQNQYYKNNWNNLRWRLLFKIFFSKFIMGRLGRDPQFMSHINVDSVQQYIFNKTDKHLRSNQCQDNYILEYILTGNYNNTLPYYLSENNYKLIQKDIDKIEFLPLGINEFCSNNNNQYSIFNLSNIFEYMNEEGFINCSRSLLNCSSKDARFIYWNLMTPRNLKDHFSFIKKYDNNNEVDLSKDKGFFYNTLHIDHKIQ